MSVITIKNINIISTLFLTQEKPKLIAEDADVSAIWEAWSVENKHEWGSSKKSMAVNSLIIERIKSFFDEFGCILFNEVVWDALNTKKYAQLVTALWSDEENQNLLKEAIEALPKRSSTKQSGGIKRNKSAYLFCCAHFRDTVKAENPDMSPQQITKVLGEKWGAISTDKGELFDEFTKLALDDKARYELENPSKAVAKSPSPKKKSPSRSPGKPRGKSAWVIFCEIKRGDVKEKLGSEATNKEVMHELGLMWASDEYTKVKVMAEERSIESKERVKAAAAAVDDGLIIEDATPMDIVEDTTTTKSVSIMKTPTKSVSIVASPPCAPAKDTAKARLNILLADDDDELEDEDEDISGLNQGLTELSFE